MKTLLSDPYGVCSRRYTEGFTLIFPNSKPGADREPARVLRFERGWMSHFGPTAAPSIAPERKRYHD
jgi:hypothetical protein